MSAALKKTKERSAGLSSHLHCSAVIAQRITAADVTRKNGFSQDDSDPLIRPWGDGTDAGGRGHVFTVLIRVMSVDCMAAKIQTARRRGDVFAFWFCHSGGFRAFAPDTEPLIKARILTFREKRNGHPAWFSCPVAPFVALDF